MLQDLLIKIYRGVRQVGAKFICGANAVLIELYGIVNKMLSTQLSFIGESDAKLILFSLLSPGIIFLLVMLVALALLIVAIAFWMFAAKSAQMNETEKNRPRE